MGTLPLARTPSGGAVLSYCSGGREVATTLSWGMQLVLLHIMVDSTFFRMVCITFPTMLAMLTGRRLYSLFLSAPSWKGDFHVL